MAEYMPPKLALVPTPVPEPAAAPRGGSIAGDDPRIAQAATGDRAAAQALVSELLPRVRNLVRYLCRGDADVDDHAQVALLEVLRALPGFQGRSAFTTWADRITVRSTLRRIKQARTRGRVEAAQEDLDATAREPARDPERRTLDRRELARLMDALPPEQREALVMHHVVGMSVPDVARELELPFDTVKSRLRLATRRLRAMLEPNEEDAP